MTIADIQAAIKRRELTVNYDYQRSNQIWPPSAKSYFIDTILTGYPFPKIYIYAHYDRRASGSARIRKEIVDGQQRVTTMLEYFDSKFAISTRTSKFHGKRYRDLPNESKELFLNTLVEMDLILQAEPSEVLEIFRRINSYTAPLKPAERRHADYNGEFKWFINALIDQHAPILEAYGILSPKSIVRMGDAEFVTELTQVLDIGIVDKSEAALAKMYHKYDKTFPRYGDFQCKIDEFFEVLTSTLKPFARTPLMKSYNVYSLFCALIGRRYGFPGSREIGIKKSGTFFHSTKAALSELKKLTLALENAKPDGPYNAYLEVSQKATTRVSTRRPRALLLVQYLNA